MPSRGFTRGLVRGSPRTAGGSSRTLLATRVHRGEVNDHPRSAPRRGLDTDPGVVRIGNPAGDREAEPRPVRLPPGRISAVEALEHVGELLGRDADAGVRYDHRRPAVLDGHVETHMTPGGRELDGIVEDDQEQLADERSIP